MQPDDYTENYLSNVSSSIAPAPAENAAFNKLTLQAGLPQGISIMANLAARVNTG